MTRKEMKLAVCEKLPELIRWHPSGRHYWKGSANGFINWPTEGLQVCHEAEKKLQGQELLYYCYRLKQILNIVEEKLPVTWQADDTQVCLITATYEQRLEALLS